MLRPNLKEKITAFALSHGFDLVGFTGAEPFTRTQQELQARKTGGVYPDGLAESDLMLRTHPAAMLRGSKTIICLAVAYSTVDPTPVRQHEMRGLLSRYAWGQDYHRIVPVQLNELIDYMNVLTDGRHSFLAMADTGPISDRAAAERAGLGFFGWNSTLITNQYGSWVFLAEILTDMDIEPDTPLGHPCAECGRCMDACPTGAIYEPYRVNPYKCLSFITQMREDIPPEYYASMGNRLFGCDTCQAVCPHNVVVKTGARPEFLPGPAGTAPYLPPLFTMSNREFSAVYGPTAASWRGKRVLQRNAAIILGNQQTPEALEHLVPALDDPKPQIRRAAAWACLQIETGLARNLVEKRCQIEADPATQQYLRSLLLTH